MRRLLFGLLVSGVGVLSPSWATAGDKEVAQQVAAQLRGSGLKGYKIGVKVHEGTAWLQGTVTDEQQLARALSAAEQTEGIDRVVNNLSIAAPVAAVAPTGVKMRQPKGMISGNNHRQPAARPQPRTANGRNSNRLGAAAGPTMAAPVQQVSGAIEDPSMNSAPRGQWVTRAGGAPRGVPLPYRQIAQTSGAEGMGAQGSPIPAYVVPTTGGGVAPARFDHPRMPGYSWPSYASYPNYAGVTYPQQYSPTAWPFIGPFYPYPQVPLGWRKVTLEWDDGWWMLDFKQ